MKSILQNEKKCYVTGIKANLHKHHVFGGANRKVSEQNGFFIWLLPYWHNMSDVSIHFDKAFDSEVKRACQAKFEETHSREEFMKLIGRSYL